MQLVGTKGQQVRTHFYDASGTITSGGTAQLIVPEALSRSSWVFVNNSDTTMYLEIGSARATATISGGKVTSVAVTNAGFGFTKAPTITFLGGGNTGWDAYNSAFLGGTTPDYPAPAHPATAHCVLSGSSIGSIVVDDGGSGYVIAPYCLIENSLNDPYGCATPSAGGAGSIPIITNGSYTNNGVVCVTDPIAVFCASSSKAFAFKYTM